MGAINRAHGAQQHSSLCRAVLSSAEQGEWCTCFSGTSSDSIAPYNHVSGFQIPISPPSSVLVVQTLSKLLLKLRMGPLKY
jgi:hypothetical protein